MDCISGWCRSKRRLDGMTAIVTGCNTGIGKETVADLYIRGARVIMACRDTKKAEAAKKDIEEKVSKATAKSSKPTGEVGTLVVEKLDVSRLKSVREFVERILESEPKIHILINNAGIMCVPKGKTEDGFETQMGTNHYGHALLTLLLLPRLKKSAPARVVFVSSYLHRRAHIDMDDWNFEKMRYEPTLGYYNSKAANILFAKGLALKLKENNINNVTTYSLHPGLIKTEIGRNFSDTMWFGAGTFNTVMAPFMKSVKCGAQTSIYCALDEACAEESGLYYSDCAVTKPSRTCRKEEFAIKFWDHTIEALKLADYNMFADSDPPKQLIE